MSVDWNASVSKIGEFRLIDEICSLLPTTRDDVLIPPGDDAAVIRPQENLVLTTDVLVEGVDFDFRYCPPESVGHKALAANLSDIAAMGAVPDHILIGWGAPGDTKAGILLGMAKGLGDFARTYDLAVVGGDISSAKEVFIAITVTGHTHGHDPIGYHSAHPGDGIYVTGNLGDSLLGYLLLSGAATSVPEKLRERHLLPSPRLHEMESLLEHLPITALTDISDGLSRDLHKMCKSSGVGAVIEDSHIPLSEELRSHAAQVDRDSIDLAVQGGEDFELLFTVDESQGRHALEALQEQAGLRISRLGSCTEDRSVRHVRRDGTTEELPIRGWEHFADE